MSVDLIGAKFLRQTLLDDPDIAAYTEVTHENDVVTHRIYIESMPEEADPPAIVIEYYRGGYEQATASIASDLHFKVCVHTPKKADAFRGAELIEAALNRKNPSTPTEYENLVLPYTWITLVMPFTDHYPRQKSQWNDRGGIYRIRLSHMSEV
jgi:hypothetical protein